MLSTFTDSPERHTSLDPIRLEILRNALVAAAEEMGIAICRASRSQAIREMLDFSTALFDVRGRNIAQAARIPMHLNSMAPCLETILAHFIPLEAWNEGDVVLTNDPYCGGQHLPDLITFKPIFIQGQCFGFAGAICHHSDVGGPAPGSYNALATEIFAEGLRIPPVRIRKHGTLNEELLSLILQNVREPATLKADLMAQIAALDVGRARVIALIERYGAHTVAEATSAILAQSEQAVRQTISKVPEGTYVFSDYVDDDGITDTPIRISVEVTVRNGEMTVDLSGSSAQVAGPINCTLNIAKSAIYYAVMTALGGEFQANSGCYAPIKIIAPAGTVINALSPAPVVSRINVGHRIVNVILGALAKAKPGSIPAAYYGVSYFYALQAVSSSGERSIYVDSIVGGWGAEPNRDGASTFSCGLHNLASIPIETIERHHAITFTRYSLRPDSGGAGRQRGGLGMIREWRLEAAEGTLSVSFDRFRFAPGGIEGGRPGATGRLWLTRAGRREALRSKMVGMRLRKGDVITVETSGGGGFGLPKERSRAAIAADIRAGYVTPGGAKAEYEFSAEAVEYGA